MAEAWKNQLYFGDNLNILREHIKDESVDLIYLDPPFNSNATYNVLFKEKSGEESTAQLVAFDDTWHWGLESENTYYELVAKHPGKIANLMQAFRSFLGTNDMMAYLTMMSSRLVELHRVLKPTGSLYLHCDPTASHYLKLLMDSIFGIRFFMNEIIWKRTSAHNDPNRYGANIDVILFYTKSDNWIWNQQHIKHDPEYIQRFRNKDSDGRLWTDDNLTAKGLSGGGYNYEYRGVTSLWRCPISTMEKLDKENKLHFTKKGGIRLKRYLDETSGVPLQAFWEDIFPINSQAKERLGYPTQKPEALLERIIKSSSNEDDIVLDPFCGCGTTIAVAERLRRRWIGIDVTHLAIALMKHRLAGTFESELSPYQVKGVPTDLAGAEALAKQSRDDFECWAVSLVDAYPFQTKKGADSGIDGIINFFDDNSGKAKKIVIQVKSGKVGASQIRDLKGVLEREKAAIAAFITLEEPTSPMVKEAVSAGFYEPEFFPGKRYPRLQILTIKELLEGKKIDFLQVAESTFKKAQPKVKDAKNKQPSLFD